METEFPPLPGYRVTGRLGQGAFGIVLAAELERDPSTQVAIKVMKPGVHVRAKDVLRFRREGAMGRELHHAHILPVLDVGNDGTRDYIVMERVDGETLQQRIARRHSGQRGTPEEGRVQLIQDLKILARVCRAAGYAHAHGVVHRDIKPGNILVRADGHPFLIDFGLARRVDGESTLTSSGVVLGTFFYMAPEQLTGDAKRIGAPSDVYALGATLHAICTGRVPFTAPTYEELRRIVLEHEVPRAPEGLPKGLEAIWLRALEKQPQHRYPTAEAMAEDLERVVQGVEPLPTGTPLFALRGWRSLLRRRAGIVGGVSFVLVVAVLLLWWHARDRDEQAWLYALSRAEIALQEEDLSAAVEALRRADALYPADPTGPLRLAVALVMLGDEEGRQKSIAEAARRGFQASVPPTDSPRSLIEHAYFALSRAEYDRARHWLERAHELDPKNRECLMALARIAWREHDLDRALGFLTELERRLRPDSNASALVHVQKAELTGDYAAALAELRASESTLGLSPSEASAWRGRILLRGGREAEALVELRRAVENGTRIAATWTNLANAELRAGDPSRAEASAHRALELDPREGHAMEVLALLRYQAGDAVGATEWLVRAAKPEDGQRITAALSAQRQFEEALKREDAGDEAGAREAYEAALGEDPDHLGALLTLGAWALEQSENAKAAELLERGEAVFARCSRPGPPNRDLWSRSFAVLENEWALHVGAFLAWSRAGDLEHARAARDRVEAKIEATHSIPAKHAQDYALELASSATADLRDPCRARSVILSAWVQGELENSAELTAVRDGCLNAR